ncbi:MAG: hypothetical protein R2862_10260 [Thermoanaerobaculia bacterium]
MCRAIVKHEPGEHPFVPETFFTPAVGEWARRGLSVPRLALEALWAFARNPATAPSSIRSRACPAPCRWAFSTTVRSASTCAPSIRSRVRTDDFRELDRRLFVVAAELESGKSVIFGSPGFDHVPISRAVQASSALRVSILRSRSTAGTTSTEF